MLGQPAPGEVEDLGGDPLALQILDRLDGRIDGHREHPADGPSTGLAQDQLAQLEDIGPALDDPVVSGQPAVEHAVGDITRDLLGTQQRAGDLGVVDLRVVAPRGLRDGIARTS